MPKTNAVWLQDNARGNNVLDQIQVSLEETANEVLAIRDEVGKQRKLGDDHTRAINQLAHEITSSLVNGGGLHLGGPHALQAQKAALVEFMRTGRITAGMTASDDPSGGFLIPEELDAAIHRLMVNRSPMRSLARVVRTRTANYSKLVNKGGAGGYWAANETSTVAETTPPEFAQITPPLGEMVAEPRISQTLLDDSGYNTADEIMFAISEAFAELKGAAFTSGDGVGKPRGFLTHTVVSTSDASRPFGHIQYVPTGVAAALTDGSNNGADAIIDLVFSLQAKYRANAAFTMNSATAGKVRKFKDSEGRHLWSDSLADGVPNRLLGYPTVIDENMPDVGAGEYPIAFADWQAAYTIADRTDMRVLLDPYTAKPWVKYYTTKRVGGHSVDTKAIKLLKVAAS